MEYIKLRGHHLICLHFFSGEGYSPEFVTNLHELIKRLADEVLLVYERADDVCLKCPYLKDGKCLYSEDSEKEIMEMDKKALELLKIKPETKINWQTIKERLPGIFREWFLTYCTGCAWKKACINSPLWQELNMQRCTKA
ncbi:MAG: DUF1284 domain-containing protein [Nitrospirae bacterium]|nr:DUF1284 domain-containing protein [Nitrospirota bacterium]